MNNSIPTGPVNPKHLTHEQTQAAMGVLIGAAVGDALGAPFEFRPGGEYKIHFPQPVLGGAGELIGGGAFNWAPGEFTDDTQMAMCLAAALIENAGEFDAETVWEHFVAWGKTAKDIGNTTRYALSSPDRATAAAYAHEMLSGRTGSNGSVMRIAPIGIAGVRWGRERTMHVAREQSGITHFDPIAGWAAAIAAEVIRACILGARFATAVYHAVQLVDEQHRPTFEEFLSETWEPQHTTKGNGGAVVCLAQAVWAVRNTTSFEDAVVAAVNLGDDADTVAAVTGALAGAVYGIAQIPARWSTYVNGSVTQPDGTQKRFHQHDLLAVAHVLVGKASRPITEPEPTVLPTQIHEAGVFACNLLGAPQANKKMGIVSLCRMEDLLHSHPYRREFYIIDKWSGGHNPHLHAVTHDAVNAIEAFLAEGREVVVHCHGGRSRTGFILKAWYMKTFSMDHTTADLWLHANWPYYATWNEDFTAFLENEWLR